MCDKKAALQKYGRLGWALPVMKQGCLSLGQNEQFQPPDIEDTSSESFRVFLRGGWYCSGVCLGVMVCVRGRGREREKREGGLAGSSCKQPVLPRVWEPGLLYPSSTPHSAACIRLSLLSFLLPNPYFLNYKITAHV